MLLKIKTLNNMLKIAIVCELCIETRHRMRLWLLSGHLWLLLYLLRVRINWRPWIWVRWLGFHLRVMEWSASKLLLIHYHFLPLRIRNIWVTLFNGWVIWERFLLTTDHLSWHIMVHHHDLWRYSPLAIVLAKIRWCLALPLHVVKLCPCCVVF